MFILGYVLLIRIYREVEIESHCSYLQESLIAECEINRIARGSRAFLLVDYHLAQISKGERYVKKIFSCGRTRQCSYQFY
jgi:hypothetical protein